MILPGAENVLTAKLALHHHKLSYQHASDERGRHLGCDYVGSVDREELSHQFLEQRDST